MCAVGMFVFLERLCTVGWGIGVLAEVGGGGKWFDGLGIRDIFGVCDWGLVGWVFYVVLIGPGMAFVGL